MQRTASTYRRKSPKLEDVRPLFDLHQDQPFLLRPLTSYERSVILRWINFYKDRLRKGPCFPTDCMKDFLAELTEKRYVPYSVVRENGGLFQNLFRYSNRTGIYGALTRITGTTLFSYSAIERELAFKEVVKLHRERFGDDILPCWRDFNDYHRDRVFLSETGVIALPYEALVYGEQGFPNNDIEHFYRMYFKIPEEITEDQLQQLANRMPTAQELIDNYKNVVTWQKQLEVNDPELVPSQIDIDVYAQKEGGIPWDHYRRWIYCPEHLKAADPKDVVRSLDWIRQQAGVIRTKRWEGLKVNAPEGYWTKETILEGYIAAWQSMRTDKCFPERGRLIDPPSAVELARINKIHKIIKDQNGGKLIPGECEEYGVPLVHVPGERRIKRSYPGGIIGLLGDIERRYCGEGGIEFTNSNQLRQLHRTYLNSGMPSSCAPKNIVSHVPRSLVRT